MFTQVFVCPRGVSVQGGGQFLSGGSLPKGGGLCPKGGGLCQGDPLRASATHPTGIHSSMMIFLKLNLASLPPPPLSKCNGMIDTAILYSCLRLSLAGPSSIALLQKDVLDYLFANLVSIRTRASL